MKRIMLILAAAAISATLCAQETGWAVVNLSANFMRENPDYAAENGDQALMGTVVKVLEHQSYWTRIETAEPYAAWTNAMGLIEMTTEQKDAYVAAPKLICTAEYTHVYSEPDGKRGRVCDLVAGDLLRYGGEGPAAERRNGFVKVLLPSGVQGWVRAREVDDFGRWLDSRQWTGESISALACSLVGVPYMWGGTSVKDVDCSGLTNTVYKLHGILLPRNASQQALVGEEIPLDEARPGDLVFFGRAATEDSPEKVTHTSVYIGGGEIIHASQMVRRNSIVPGSENYYGGTILHVRRILGHVDDGTGVTSMRRSPAYCVQ